ncbi:hypothetical protein EMN47_13810 [Prolixibacteraceae bacterium JC049]|nr:hypothetical protein [Prolixibacteraceae bacterium JC049]
MNKLELQNSANLLPRVSEETANNYRAKTGAMTEQVNQILLENEAIDCLIGNENIDLMKNNHENHASFMVSILDNFKAEILVNTILWVFKVYRSRGFNPAYWQEQLHGWIAAVKTHIDTQHQKEIIDYYQWMLDHVNDFTELTDIEVKEESKS